jgi:hypothetical protein
MRNFYTLLLFLLATISILAQTPEKMSYQLVLRDASNTLLTNQEVGIQISILQTTITGTAVYTETQTATTNINGLVSLEIGSGTSSDDFSAIDWSTGPFFIKTATDASGGSNYSIIGTSQLMSVPFALYAKTSGSSTPGPQGEPGIQGETGTAGAAGTNGTNGTQGIQGVAGNAGVGIAQTLSFISPNLELSDSGGSIDLTALINDADSDISNELQSLEEVLIKGNNAAAQIKNVTDPTDAQDATTKVYVDAQDATTKAYLDALIATLEARIAVFEPQPASVGDFRDGGIVFWVDPTNNTLGKVCALEDVSNEDGQTLLNWADAISYSFGYTNPDTGTGVYGDWYLPSKDELQLMYANLQRFGCNTVTPITEDFCNPCDLSLCATRKGEFSDYYWSSTEFDGGNGTVSYQYFINGFASGNTQDTTHNVRAVRAF